MKQWGIMGIVSFIVNQMKICVSDSDRNVHDEVTFDSCYV